MVGTTISTSRTTATAEAIGQSRAEENSSEISRPIIGLEALPTSWELDDYE